MQQLKPSHRGQYLGLAGIAGQWPSVMGAMATRKTITGIARVSPTRIRRIIRVPSICLLALQQDTQLLSGSHAAAETFSSGPVSRVVGGSQSAALGDGGDGDQEDDHGDRQGQSNQDPSNHPRTSICLICASTSSTL